jgi:hypothetical protein
MIKTIYKIVKPSDPMTTYVGSTKDLKTRLIKHNSHTLNCLLGWFDDTCYLEPIEVIEVEGTTEKETRRFFEKMEREWMSKLPWAGYTILNSNVGKSKVEGYQKSWYENNADDIRVYNSQPHKKQARNHYQKTSQHAKKYRQGFYKYYYKAKQEGLTVKEYKIKYQL